ncbi:ComEC/Rec2 family competence protein [Vibrio campbellii]
MGYEIDFHPVGNETKSGDAISMRFVDENEDQFVVVIDGGYKSDGEVVCKHIKEFYKTETIDLVISTHPDSDHINGLFTILESMEVKKLAIAKPWEFDGLSGEFSDNRFTDNSLSKRVAEQLNKSVELVDLAEAKSIEVVDPFTGFSFEKCGAALITLGPSEEYYRELLPQILDEKPEEKSLSESLSNSFEGVINLIKALWGKDNLSEDVTTSPLNSTSVITLINYDGRSLLFTGDAGVEALQKAESMYRDYVKELKLMQIPHHGSRRNISSSILDTYVGEPKPKGSEMNMSAIASAAKKSDKHPRACVTNAFIHRGVKTVATKGSTICYRHNMPARDGWTTTKCIEYKEEFEE